MEDRLVWLLKRFELRANLFQTGKLKRGADSPFDPHAGVLHILNTGSVRLTESSGIVHELHEPSAFFYMNPKKHRIEPHDDTVNIVCSTFEFGIGLGNPLQAALPDLFVLRASDSPTLALPLAQLQAECAQHHCGRDAILERLSEMTLILILRDLMDRRLLNIGLLAGLSDKKLVRTINAIHAHPEKDWTLDTMAETALMSRARFSERFHRVVGMTPGNYLSDWRIGLAKSMLLKGASVQTIALDVGYSSASAFSRIFSSRCGTSPTQWRRASRQIDDQSRA